MTGVLRFDPEQVALVQHELTDAAAQLGAAAGRVEAVLAEVGHPSGVATELRATSRQLHPLIDELAVRRGQALDGDRWMPQDLTVDGRVVCLPAPYLGAVEPQGPGFVARLFDGIVHTFVETGGFIRDLAPLVSTHEDGAIGMWRDTAGGLASLATSPGQWLPVLLDLETLDREGIAFWVGSLAATIPTAGAGRINKGAKAAQAANATTRLTAAGRARIAHLDDDVIRQVDDAIDRAARGQVRFPKHDGKSFRNRDGRLPAPPSDRPRYYQEWTAAGSGRERGAHRVIIGGDAVRPDVIYYWNHANDYVRVWP